VAALGAGFQHSCALTTAGGVKCWGSNAFGELGDNTTTGHVAAADVSGLSSGVTAIAIGASFGCALTNAGAVRCWGKNGGSLGTGDIADRLTPALVLGLGAAASAIAAGESHACALAAGGVKCWGLNGAGQIGDGTTTTRLVATDVTGLPAGITGIAVGQRHSCALTSSGGVKCWGENDHGQLGDGTTTDRTRPVDVTGLQSGVRALALSANASCALMVSGTVKCWGGNDFAEQGTGGTPRATWRRSTCRASAPLRRSPPASIISAFATRQARCAAGASTAWASSATAPRTMARRRSPWSVSRGRFWRWGWEACTRARRSLRESSAGDRTCPGSSATWLPAATTSRVRCRASRRGWRRSPRPIPARARS
jgi:hypothetical protein